MQSAAQSGRPVASSLEAGTVACCAHCGSQMLEPVQGRFCCTGCAAVYGLLHERGLDRYYDLCGETCEPVANIASPERDLKWIESIEARIAQAEASARVELDVQGLHCSGCVWLLQTLFDRQPGGVRAVVNPALGRVELIVTRSFSLRGYVRDVEQFGYVIGPALKQDGATSRALLLRVGVCAALAVNAMIFAFPLYLGLNTEPLRSGFAWISFLLTSASVVVGGSVFFDSAWRALRKGLLHLDLPIALGILLAFSGSIWAFAHGRDARGAYFDTLATFITLMLTGRWLQERVLERNRRYLLASDGVDGLLARRVRDGALEVIACRDIAAGDSLLIAPGDVVPTDGVLVDMTASCSLDWISGESAPRAFSVGETVPAGAFNAGAAAITLVATSAFESSALVALLRTPDARSSDAARATTWWQRLTARYVAGVLVVALAGFAGWLIATGDLLRATDVATAILVVTCPCAFGLATPMAYELVLAGLRRAGLFVRSASFLDRAPSVRRVVFDKTGTLTTGALRVDDTRALLALSNDEREALFNLAARSTHPKSVAVRRALEAQNPRFLKELAVHEHAGLGLELQAHGRCYRLGEPSWACRDAAGDADVVFSVDGLARAACKTREELRPDAAREVAELRAAGYDVWILSGDAPSRVAAMAHALDVDATHAIGGCSPQRKSEWIARTDSADTLMLGDGINDALAVERAFCSGTPAIDRPFMPARTDFYFVTPGLRPIGLALRAARALERVHRRNLVAALTYNAVAVALSLSGLMSPLLCAVFMPVSSLSVLLATVASLSGRSSLWKYSSYKSL